MEHPLATGFLFGFGFTLAYFLIKFIGWGLAFAFFTAI